MIHIDDLEPCTEARGDRCEVRVKLLGKEAGGKDLGCMLYELPPGKQSWPYHFHWANEEAIYVLAGQGTLRTPHGEVAVGAGDYLAFPAGPEHAHQMINRGSEPLRYLCFSTMLVPDIAEYPDVPGKMALFFDCPPGREGNVRFGAFHDADYWNGLD
ncbi:MAG: cupin domain-containing protein [Deltaproteobacteria bacterium]|nr:MAG: cupin domain-containing protein [Deltaproteobacteria bacterium]TMQ05680.1 MAG: cupin domain-containing protein [Deltaproteobacteria bacterium]